ncbi:MAG: phosphoenolpyruvate--protein phosphotransferase [Elusimicrobia bacterium RIFOXYA2_FULL_58_8]|nr:MAG: phosphoenolpyruvate--protein phosphotransferase [Elusimicrobia bacterium RIFOXYA12_FULL_57_11]OGS13824.1 MAG: phosphoenolpyruvate--protein phosphotransferase [Elusimicrobia bacterium RIFOXYA2_FULL_58_8]
MKKGVAASLGIVIGKAYILKEENILIEQKVVAPEKIKAELKRFKDALEKTRLDLDGLRNKILNVLGKQHAKLIDTHHLILQDPLITKEVPKLITSKAFNAEFALSEVLDRAAEQFEKIDDEFFHERKHDIFDVGKKIISNLVNNEKVSLKDLKEPVILVAHNLYPSDTLHIRESNKVLGFCMDLGSKSSHTAIFAQSMGIPAVVGLSDISRQIQSGDTIVVDGEQGMVIISPTAEIVEKYKARREELQKQEHFFHRLKGLPAITRDGHKISLMANLDSSADAPSLAAVKAEGVGLYRTESLYMNRNSVPTEAEQIKAYAAVVKAAPALPLVIRTADIGGDRATQLGIKGLKDEQNPFMGFRGIRLFIKYPELLKTQLRAIYKANTEGNIKIMIPMLSSLDELMAVKKIAQDVRTELAEEGFAVKHAPEFGVMVEIPAAAIILDSLLGEIDFVSIGTNDLVQYILAVDRINQYVSELYEPFHPAVLRIINLVVQTAHKKGKPVSVCGEMASDPFAIPLLVGMGVDVLSVPPKIYLRAKAAVRSMNFEKFAGLAQRVLGMPTAQDIRRLVEEEVK